jgi:hypothetical protein
VTDPTELLRRAAELTERADHEEDIETREQLLRISLYVQLAESQEWLAAHPPSVASLRNVLTPKSD